MLRAVAEYSAEKGLPEVSAEIHKLADDLLPTPDPGYRLERAASGNMEVWQVVNIKTGKALKRGSNDFIRKLPDDY